MQDLDDEFDDDPSPLTTLDAVAGGIILMLVMPIGLAALATECVARRLGKLLPLVLSLIIAGCSELTVEDVVEACVVQCEERGGQKCEPECLDFAEAYADCVPEAYALVDCMPAEPCDAERAELAACAQ